MASHGPRPNLTRLYDAGCAYMLKVARFMRCVAICMFARCTLQPKRPEAVGTDPTRNPRPRAGGRSLPPGHECAACRSMRQAGAKCRPAAPPASSLSLLRREGRQPAWGFPAGTVVPHPAMVYIPPSSSRPRVTQHSGIAIGPRRPGNSSAARAVCPRSTPCCEHCRPRKHSGARLALTRRLSPHRTPRASRPT